MGTVFKRLALCAVLVSLCVMPAAAREAAGPISAIGGTAGIPGELPGTIIVDQITDAGCDLTHGCLWSNNCTGAYSAYTGISADDFVVLGDYDLNGISVEGAWTSGTVLDTNEWFIYEDTGGSGPGAVVCAIEGTPVQAGASDQYVVFDTSECPTPTSGIYWLGYYPSLDCGIGTWCWVGGTTTNGSGAYIYDEGFCGPAWVPNGPDCDEDLVGGWISDLCFSISAEEAAGEGGVPATSTVGLGILLALMLAAGFYFMRRRQTA